MSQTPPGVHRLNRASYVELRALDLSHAQVGRLLSHRERVGEFRSLDELDDVSGLSADDLGVLKKRLACPDPEDAMFTWGGRPRDASAHRPRRGIKYEV